MLHRESRHQKVLTATGGVSPAPLVSYSFPQSNVSSTLSITGRTWAFRRDLTALGARWNPQLQAWLAPADRRPQLDALATIADINIALLDPASGRPAPLPRSRPFLSFMANAHATSSAYTPGPWFLEPHHRPSTHSTTAANTATCPIKTGAAHLSSRISRSRISAFVARWSSCWAAMASVMPSAC